MRCFSGLQRVSTRRVSFRFVPDTLGGLQAPTQTLPLRWKISMPFAAVLTPSARWRHGDNIQYFLNKETGTSAHCWQTATTFTFLESIIRGWAVSLPRANATGGRERR